jgi:signal peptidase II
LVFLGFSCVAVGLIFYLYRTTPANRPLLATGFALVFGGAIGNMIDRFRLGKVIDFLDVYLGKWHWPAFNVADSAVTVGIGIFFFHLIVDREPSGGR